MLEGNTDLQAPATSLRVIQELNVDAVFVVFASRLCQSLECVDRLCEGSSVSKLGGWSRWSVEVVTPH